VPALPASRSTLLAPWVRSLATTTERLLRRHRTPVVLGLIVIAVLSALDAIGGSAPRATNAVVVVRDVPAGAALSSDDVALRPVDGSTVPATALRSLDDAIGRRLTVAASTHEILTPDRLVVPRAIERSGAVLAPVRLADGEVAGLLATGDRVDVLAATADAAGGGAAAAVVAENARVAAVPIADADQGGWLSAGPARSDGMVVVEVPPEAAARIAGAAASARLSVVLRAASSPRSR
jgi:Flp pilus assembly protein CpaB